MPACVKYAGKYLTFNCALEEGIETSDDIALRVFMLIAIKAVLLVKSHKFCFLDSVAK